MSKGRKPTAVPFTAHSNPGKRARPRNVPMPDSIAEDEAPAWLSAKAKEIFDDLQPELARWGCYTILDRPLLWTYCQTYALYVHCIEQLQLAADDGGDVLDVVYETSGRNGDQFKVRPYLTQATSLAMLLRSLASEFGLSPSARRNLEGVTQLDLFGQKSGLDELKGRFGGQGKGRAA